MVMLNEGNANSLFRMDLEVGKVVEEWKVHDIAPVDSVTPSSKYAQMTPEATMVGINGNSIFRIDPRLSGNKRVESETNEYKSKNKFSCAATTGNGYLAVGSDKGDIRLYNKLNIRAKTHLPGLGDPIIGVDVSEDGKWIIATCDTYVLLLTTDPGDHGPVGYEKSMGAKKPIPKRLQLKPEHVSMMNAPVKFTTARFNTGEGEEKTIVTSTGPYVITWNFRRVKLGHLTSYQIKKYSDVVVSDQFQYGNDRSIVVALPHDVTMATKMSSPNVVLKKEYERNQLQTPTKNLKSRNSIVNSPY